MNIVYNRFSLVAPRVIQKRKMTIGTSFNSKFKFLRNWKFNRKITIFGCFVVIQHIIYHSYELENVHPNLLLFTMKFKKNILIKFNLVRCIFVNIYCNIYRMTNRKSNINNSIIKMFY